MLGISAVVTRDRVFSQTSNYHAGIINFYKLSPLQKVEVIYYPKNGDFFDTTTSNWELSTLTRASHLPSWFWRAQCVKQMHELLLERHSLGYYISDSPSVVIDSSETYHLRNSGILLKSGHIHVYDRCSVLGTGDSGSSITIHGPANAVVANNSVQVIANSIQNNNIIVLNNKSVLSITDLFESESVTTCRDNLIIANDETRVEDYRYQSTGSTLMLRGRSKIKLYNRGKHE